MKNIIKSPIKLLWLMIGIVSMVLGAIGVVLPVLPTTPFLLLASFCFAKGSDRFHKWFIGTKLYKKHLESFVTSRSMTLKTKLCILLPASAMLILAMLAMSNIYGRVFIVFLIIVTVSDRLLELLDYPYVLELKQLRRKLMPVS
jgi:uncharacterized membrane protein YbaN (DUF454 family)